MKQSNLFTKTLKEAPKDEKSLNAQLLIRAGFVDKLASGLYTYLPLGLRVIKKLQTIVREEMDNIGGQEILMPSLTPKENWVTSGRWDVEEMYKIVDEDMGLGWTHEEVVTPLIKKHILSHKDLPKYIYQIQTKFRNEPRAKSGLLRGREFIMKDLYSFHDTQEDLDEYYEKVKQAYNNVYERCGIKELTYLALASGGKFSEKYSHEFQTITDAGEDIIFICKKCQSVFNKEVQEEKCPICGNTEFTEKKSIEVGNIFKLNTRYSEPFGLKTEKGTTVIMGCYGIGISRLMGAIVEALNDGKGIVWPKSVAPFQIHLVEITGGDEKIKQKTEEIYEILQNKNFEVLYDNRDDKTAGEKLNDSDLIGVPLRVVVSKKTLEQDSVEVKYRNADNACLIKITEITNYAKESIQ
jgi:prolyl-tRNA synthetase